MVLLSKMKDYQIISNILFITTFKLAISFKAFKAFCPGLDRSVPGICLNYLQHLLTYETKSSRVDQVNFVEDSLKQTISFQIFKRLFSTKLTYSSLEYFVPYILIFFFLNIKKRNILSRGFLFTLTRLLFIFVIVQNDTIDPRGESILNFLYKNKIDFC